MTRLLHLLQVALPALVCAAAGVGCTSSTDARGADSHIDAAGLDGGGSDGARVADTGLPDAPSGGGLDARADARADGARRDGGHTHDARVPPDSSGDTGATDAGADADAAHKVDCSGAGAGTFPEFERSCKSNADCAAVAHQFNCCGSERITGVRAVQVDAFKTAEATCRGQYPGCGCATQSPVADDGSAAGGGNPGPVAVACNAGTCETSFSSDATTPCGPELSCDAATEICVAREPVGPAITYTCEPAAAGCYNARGCACSAAALCTGGFNTCHDDAVNKITCECQLCQ